MTSFLEKTARFLLDRFPDTMQQVCVVLPNRRAGVFLKMYLSRQTENPFFAPTIFSIEDFIFRLSGFRKTEPAYLLFEFYEVYRSMNGAGSDSFQEFMKWAEVVLKDFNELDLSLTDPDQLFGYLSDSKAMALWNPDNTPLTPFQVRYLHFYQSLAGLYTALKIRLTEKKMAYQGLAYRKLAESANQTDEASPWEVHVFAGLNALTAAEEMIVQKFSRNRTTHLLWDADPYYLDDQKQEAGFFLRKNKKTFNLGELNWTDEHFRKGSKEIYIVGVPKVVGQAKVAGGLLEKLLDNKINPDTISLVLNDESTLFPVLNSIPDSVRAFNVTMGLPLAFTPLYDLVLGFIRLNENALRFYRRKEGPIRFYFQDLLLIFRHPYFPKMVPAGEKKDVHPAARISARNQVFYSAEEISGLLPGDETRNPSVLELFVPWGASAKQALSGLQKLLQKLKRAFSEDKEDDRSIDLEYVYQFSRIFNNVERLLETYPVIDEPEAFRRVLETIIRAYAIPFYGEPLNGIQVMGMLETRALDFEHVILLSVNDDFIPGTGISNSFIPYDIRREFKLPTHRERNAVFAYHFYRFLQRASSVYLIYNTEPGELGGGDRSRFISQLAFELAETNPNIKIREEIYSSIPDKPRTDDSIVIPKSPEILEELEKVAGNGLSASALNAFRNCSLRFYFERILGIQESDEVEETIEISTFGTVIHDVLYELYTPFKKKNLLAGDVNGMKKSFSGALHRALAKHYPEGSMKHGKNLLTLKVMESFIERFLNWEINRLKKMERFREELVIQGLEEKRSVLIQLGDNGKKEIRLNGVIDRVEQIQSVPMILDYKSGRVDHLDLKLKAWEDLLIPGKYDKLFQLLFYAILYPEGAMVEAGIISFRNLSQGILQPVLPNEAKLTEAIPDYKEMLKQLLGELFDPEKPFVQTEDEKVCMFCPFKSICNR
jgi:hypothetical protein